MKEIRKIFIVCCMLGICFGLQAQNKKNHGAVVAGHYEGDTYIELMQQELKMKLELIRTHNDSVIVVIKDFLLPTGQKFNFRSKGLSVKKEEKEGKIIYKLHTTFVETYNNMPFKITANATIVDDVLDSEVKASLMESMETKVTYKARKLKNKGN